MLQLQTGSFSLSRVGHDFSYKQQLTLTTLWTQAVNKTTPLVSQLDWVLQSPDVRDWYHRLSLRYGTTFALQSAAAAGCIVTNVAKEAVYGVQRYTWCVVNKL